MKNVLCPSRGVRLEAIAPRPQEQKRPRFFFSFLQIRCFRSLFPTIKRFFYAARKVTGVT